MSWQLAEQAVDWRRVSGALMSEGYAVTAPLLPPEDYAHLSSYYDDAQFGFRSAIDMARPRKDSRGYHRAKMRHGVGQITAGNRDTLGVIFHDAA